MADNLFSYPKQYCASDKRYDEAVFKRCGKSGLKMSALSLGLWHNFGGVNAYSNSREMLLTAFDNGITCFDLANNYGPPYGSAEETFGRVMKNDLHTYRHEMFIATKAGYDMWQGPYGKGGSRKYLLSSLEESMRRMNVDYVDVFYHHCMDSETPLEESMEALVQAVKSGKAMYAGISNYSAEQARKAFDYLESRHVPCLVEQSAYNMINRSVEEGGLVDVLIEKGVGMTAFSPLAQGLLTGKYNKGIPEGSRAAGVSIFLNKEGINQQTINKVMALGKIADERGEKMSTFALAWLLSRPSVASVIIGASSAAQILENIAATKAKQFSQAELEQVEKIITEV